MDKKKILFLIGFLIVLSLFLSFGQVKADNPTSMTVEYDQSIETLNVTISHSSENFNTHYIFEVIVTVNGVQLINQSYTSQPSNTFMYSYYLNSGPLEILNFIIEVTAQCTQAGIITRVIKVGQVDQPSEGIPGFIGLWFIMGASMIALIVFNNKKLKK